jgi:putative transposase
MHQTATSSNWLRDIANGRLRDECLNEHWFPNLLQARAVIETWRREYNQERPKKGFGGMTPEAYAKHLAEVRLQ